MLSDADFVDIHGHFPWTMVQFVKALEVYLEVRAKELLRLFSVLERLSYLLCCTVRLRLAMVSRG